MVSWDSKQERRAAEHISHLAPSTQRNERAGGRRGRELGSARRMPGWWGTGDLGYTKMGKEDLGKILLFLQRWDFGLQKDPIFCQKREERAG